jgi:hypothetical protein
MKHLQLVRLGLVGSLLLAACGHEGPLDHENIGESAAALGGATPLASAAERRFDGTDDRVTVPNQAKHQFGSGDYTLEATVKFTNAPRAYEPIMSSRTGYTDGFLFVIYNNTLLIQMNGVNFSSQPLPNLGDGKSHHLAVTRAGGIVTVYVDGKAWGSVTSGRPIASTGPLFLGYDKVDGRGFGGSFGELRLWNVARPASALLDAANGAATNYATPGLVGAYSPNSALSQMVVDNSPLRHFGYLGSVAKGWDAQDPMWSDKATLELTAATARRTSSANARTAANEDLAICGALTINGVFDQFSGSTYSSLSEATHHFYCDNEQKNLKLAVDAAGTLKLPIKGVPVELNATNKTDVSWQKVHSYCQEDSSSMSHVEAKSWLSSTASPVLVDGFVDCIETIVSSSSPAVLQGSQSVSTDGNTIVFNLLAKLLSNGQPDTLVVDTYATGATCTGALTQTGTIVPNAQPASAICTRVGTSPVSFAVVTTQGTYLFNAGGSGVTGTAWVTGAKPVVTEQTNTKCQDFGVTYRTCLFGACKDTHHSTSFWLDTGYTKFRKPTITLMTGHSSVRDANSWLSDNDTKVNGSFYRQGKHSATMRLCAEQYSTSTTYAGFTSPDASVYGTKNFEVRVDNDYEGKALHVLTTDNNMLLQSLDAPSYSPPFVLVGKVTDPLKTTYLVKIND